MENGSDGANPNRASGSTYVHQTRKSGCARRMLQPRCICIPRQSQPELEHKPLIFLFFSIPFLLLQHVTLYITNRSITHIHIQTSSLPFLSMHTAYAGAHRRPTRTQDFKTHCRLQHSSMQLLQRLLAKQPQVLSGVERQFPNPQSVIRCRVRQPSCRQSHVVGGVAIRRGRSRYF
jgi:hypothetical protein